MLYFPFFIAWRYIRGAHREKTIATMIWICFFSIFIGSTALTITTIIMNGFEYETQKKLRSINPPIIMQDKENNSLDFNAIKSILHVEFHEISAFSPTSIEQIIVQNPHCDAQPSVIMLKVIDPNYEKKMSTLSGKITPLQPSSGVVQSKQAVDVAKLVQKNHIVMGSILARQLCITQPTEVTLLTAQQGSRRTKQLTLTSYPAIVTGIITTGIDDFDAHLALCDQAFAQSMLSEYGPTRIEIELHPQVPEQTMIEKLKARFHLDVFSWKDLYPALVSALKLEKYVMFLILALVTLIASMNVLSLLFMYITQKQADIAILLALGMYNTQIRFIFLLIGFCVSFTASILGLGIGILIGFILQYYPFIKLPDTYYVTYLPAYVDISVCISVFIVICIIGFIASWLPTRSLAYIHIANTLRVER